MVGTRGGELEVSGAPPQIVNGLWGRHGFSSEEAVPIAHCSDDSTTPVTRSPTTQPVTHPPCVITVCNTTQRFASRGAVLESAMGGAPADRNFEWRYGDTYVTNRRKLTEGSTQARRSPWHQLEHQGSSKRDG